MPRGTPGKARGCHERATMVEDAMPLVFVQGKPPPDCKDMSESLEAVSRDLATLKRAAEV
jgi:hypothetical protein